MDAQTIAPENTEERLVWYGLIWTYPLYFLGALYISGPVIGWLLFLLVAKRWLWPTANHPNLAIPWPLWLWLLGMLVMLVALLVGHLDYRLGTVQLVKSSIGWAKGWALLALFILAGTLSIRPQLLYRAAMKVCQHTLLLSPLFIFAWLLRLPETPYVSPLKFIGGPGPEFFAVSLYEIDPGSGLPRWRLFTPWAPALGFVANIFFLFALGEQNKRWRAIGLTATILMILMSQSRLAAVSVTILLCLFTFLKYVRGPILLFMGAAISYLFAFIGTFLLEMTSQFWESFKGARADSTRVRATLARIAIERWYSEAPIWGHGIVERGSHLVKYMPIGSHHSWYGLLFVKGVVGFCALAIPLASSLLLLSIRSGYNNVINIGLGCALLLFLYTFGENLEILAYLIWPALIAMGIAHCQPRDLAATDENIKANPLTTGYLLPQQPHRTDAHTGEAR